MLVYVFYKMEVFSQEKKNVWMVMFLQYKLLFLVLIDCFKFRGDGFRKLMLIFRLGYLLDLVLEIFLKYLNKGMIYKLRVCQLIGDSRKI